MKVASKRQILNRYYILTFVLAVIVPYLSWYFFSGYFEASFIWDLSQTQWSREEYFRNIFSFQNFVIEAFSLMQAIFPIFVGLAMMPFLQDQRIYSLCCSRVRSYRRFVIGSIVKHVLCACTVLYLAYCVLLLIGAAILQPVELIYERVLYSDILGSLFYADHPIAFLLIDGFHKFVICGAVYALFFTSISFYTRKWYLCILIPTVYFFGLDLALTAVSLLFGADLFFLSPVYSIMPDSRTYMGIFFVFLPLLPPLLFSLLTVGFGLRRSRKRGDVYAVM